MKIRIDRAKFLKLLANYPNGGTAKIFKNLYPSSLVIDCENIDLSGEDLSGWDISDINFTGTQFEYTDLSDTILKDTNLNKSIFTNSYGCGFDELCNAKNACTIIVGEDDSCLNKHKKQCLKIVQCYREQIQNASSDEEKAMHQQALKEYIYLRAADFFKAERKIFPIFNEKRKEFKSQKLGLSKQFTQLSIKGDATMQAQGTKQEQKIVNNPVPFKPLPSNPHSVEAYLAEMEPHWPQDFRQLIATGETKPLIDYIEKKVEAKTLSNESIRWLILCTAYYGTVNQVKALIDYGFVAWSPKERNMTVTHLAALKGDVELIKAAKEWGFGYNTPAQLGAYSNVLPVHCAIISGDIKTVALLKEKVDFSHIAYKLGEGERDFIELGWLSLAVYAGQLSVVKALLNDYPDVLHQIIHVKGALGGNILHIAVESFQQDVLEELLKNSYIRSKYLEDPDTDGLTPFALAAKLGNIPAMKALKQKGANIEVAAQSDKYSKYRPLHLAAESGERKAVAQLVIWKADVTASCIHKQLTKSPKPRIAQGLAVKQAEHIAVEAEKTKILDLRRMLIRLNMTYNAIANDLEDYRNRKDLKKFEETTAQKVIYKNLVFKGGGPKGMAYVGALMKLVELWKDHEELKDLKSIERVGGTSAGAITAALLAVGYTPKVMHDLLLLPENQPKQFLENQPLGGLGSQSLATKLKEAAKGAGYYALHPLQFGNLFINLAKDDCLCSGDVFLNWMEGHIREMTDKEWCTFGELKELIDNQKGRVFRHLHLVTIQVYPTTKIEVLSSEDPKYKDYTIAHGIRASMSIPVLFAPAQLHQLVKDAQGKRSTVAISEARYIDGGVLANYPLKLFDKAQYVYQQLYAFRDEQQKGFPVYNEETLGFYIKPEKPTEAPVYQVEEGKLAMWNAVNKLYASAQDQTHEFERNDLRSIAMENAGVTLFDFNLSKDQLNALLREGEKAIESSPLIKTESSLGEIKEGKQEEPSKDKGVKSDNNNNNAFPSMAKATKTMKQTNSPVLANPLASKNNNSMENKEDNEKKTFYNDLN